VRLKRAVINKSVKISPLNSAQLENSDNKSQQANNKPQQNQILDFSGVFPRIIPDQRERRNNKSRIGYQYKWNEPKRNQA
jgi:hypothetical protein